MLTNPSLKSFEQFCLNKPHSSQLKQDLLALFLFEEEPGFFVEFGACDGLSNSNTYVLESQYGWKGILCEPAKLYKEDLLKNRSAITDFRCVYPVSHQEVDFAECNSPELSTVASHIFSDHHGSVRANNIAYKVTTVSLDDLLIEHQAPNRIDYLSIDTEGTELDILKAFSFEYDIPLITVEHNYTHNRQNIHDLLVSKRYTRIFPEVSAWDDWYYKPTSDKN